MKRRSKMLWVLLLVVAAAAFIATQFSLGAQIGKRIESLMQQNGLQDAKVKISSYGSDHIDFSSISFKHGKQDYTLKDVRILATNLPYRELLQNNYANVAAEWTVASATVGGIDYKLPALKGKGALQMKDNKPVITGEFADEAGTHSGNFTVTSTTALLENLHAAQGQAVLSTAEIVIPYDAAKPILVESVVANQGKMHAVLESLALQRVESKDGFVADWEMDKLAISGVDYEVPTLAGAGKIMTQNDQMVLSGSVHDAKRAYSGEFNYKDKALTISRVRLPWEGATIVSEKIVVDIGKDKPVVIPVAVSQLPLETLLNKLLKEKATGTGMVSGGVVLTIYPDKTFAISNGNLQADKSGIIKISPDALPGDNKQLQLTRDVLSNFHYNILSIKTSADKDGKTAIALAIEGNNPDAYDARVVKLNINLTGDVLDLLNQTLLPLADPLQYLQKERK